MESVYFSMVVFSLIMSVSPGPVNMVCLSVGLSRGVVASIPFVFGATIGFTLLLVTIGMGLGAVFSSWPVVMNILTMGGICFMIYLGFMISRSAMLSNQQLDHVPSSVDGFLLQWLNPKAWAAAIAGIGAFGAAESAIRLSQFAAIYFVICFLGIGAWAAFGAKLRRVLASETRLLAFNRSIGYALMALSIYLLIQFLWADDGLMSWAKAEVAARI